MTIKNSQDRKPENVHKIKAKHTLQSQINQGMMIAQEDDNRHDKDC